MEVPVVTINGVPRVIDRVSSYLGGVDTSSYSESGIIQATRADRLAKKEIQKYVGGVIYDIYKGSDKIYMIPDDPITGQDTNNLEEAKKLELEFAQYAASLWTA